MSIDMGSSIVHWHLHQQHQIPKKHHLLNLESPRQHSLPLLAKFHLPSKQVVQGRALGRVDIYCCRS